jgi:hypothetical protein
MRKRALLLAAGLMSLVLLLGAVACGDDEEDGGEEPTATEAVDETPSDGETPAAGAIDVRLLEWQVVPEPASASAGDVTFNASNIGAEVHELVVIKTDLAPDGLPTDENGAVDEAGADIEVIGEIEEFAAGTEE